MIFNSECIRNLPARPAEGAGSALTALPKLPSWTGEGPRGVHREGKMVEGREAEKRGVRKSGRKKRKGIGRNERGSKCTERIWRTYLQFMPPSSPTSWIHFCIMCAASAYVSKALWDMLLSDAVASGTYGHIIAEKKVSYWSCLGMRLQNLDMIVQYNTVCSRMRNQHALKNIIDSHLSRPHESTTKISGKVN